MMNCILAQNGLLLRKNTDVFLSLFGFLLQKVTFETLFRLKKIVNNALQKLAFKEAIMVKVILAFRNVEKLFNYIATLQLHF